MEDIKNVVSIYTKTLSGDEDLLIYTNISGIAEIIENMKEDFGTEFAYIDELMLTAKGVSVSSSPIFEAIRDERYGS